MLRQIFSIILILSIGLCAAGCKKSKVPGLVSGQGTVLYDDKPLAWAIVTYSPKTNLPGSRIATAQTGVDGRFSLLTLGEKGILPGDYIVTVSKDIKDEGPKSVENWKKQHVEWDKEPIPEEGIYNTVSVIPKKYTVTKESGIEFTISPKGERDMKIVIRTSP